ncbi:alcohol dehydrogenase, putative [Babesia ovata]|uniref:Alcohol dehydrogenase, putative n=1 Tax=Babesia ovata TaxID=189622 RepID=A0A2H6KCX4_9APIC|nr:alcohol dehydrogenase, putative [Babesia ovata]GBE60846.1 alcohol dehydrogenase, putative [Babesia ovata]
MTANEWTFSTDDAELSLIHIKSVDGLEDRLSSARSINAEQNAGDRIVLDESWPKDASKSVPIHVTQGSTLSIGVLIRPKASVESYEGWKSKYSALEVSVEIPYDDGAADLEKSPRLDTLATDGISLKRTIVGNNTDPYVMHATMDTAALSNSMLGMSLPLIAYVNPKIDAGCQVPPFTLVGEVIVREILGIETAIKDNLVLVTLTNRDEDTAYSP